MTFSWIGIAQGAVEKFYERAGEGVTSAALIGNIGSGLSYVRSVLHRVPPCAWVKTAYGVPICREIEEQIGRRSRECLWNLRNGLHNRKRRWDEAFETPTLAAW